MSIKNSQELIQKIESGENFEYLFFFDYKPRQDSILDESCLSQWYDSPFIIHQPVPGELIEITMPTAEHYMMYKKLKTLKGSNPYLATKLQNKIDNYLVDGIENNLGFIKSDNYLLFSIDEAALILDKSHKEYLKICKVINRLNEHLAKKYNLKLFNSWVNREKNEIKEYNNRVAIPYIEKKMKDTSDEKIVKFMHIIYEGKDYMV